MDDDELNLVQPECFQNGVDGEKKNLSSKQIVVPKSRGEWREKSEFRIRVLFKKGVERRKIWVLLECRKSPVFSQVKVFLKRSGKCWRNISSGQSVVQNRSRGCWPKPMRSGSEFYSEKEQRVRRKIWVLCWVSLDDEKTWVLGNPSSWKSAFPKRSGKKVKSWVLERIYF